MTVYTAVAPLDVFLLVKINIIEGSLRWNGVVERVLQDERSLSP